MLKKLNVELTSACNLDCRMCFRNQWFDERNGSMSEENTERLTEVIVREGFEMLALVGMGEPLAHFALTRLVSLAHGTARCP